MTLSRAAAWAAGPVSSAATSPTAARPSAAASSEDCPDATSPTMSEASPVASVSARRTVVIRRPSRITEMRSQIASTSRALCEMNTTLVPSATMPRSEANRSSTSCGVRFVVGSSRMTIRAPR